MSTDEEATDASDSLLRSDPERLATLILTLGVASIVQRVTLDRESDSDPALRMGATLSPATDVEFTVRSRE